MVKVDQSQTGDAGGGKRKFTPPAVERWYATCDVPSCKHRYSWKGKISDRPPCPQCYPPAKKEPQKIESREVATAIEQCEHILELIDELPTRAQDFGESVSDGVRSMMDTILEMQFVTDKQWTALANWEDGVGRWIR